MPRDILLRNPLMPGDIVIETGVVRDLHRAYPGEFRIGVEDKCPQIWRHNPNITRYVHRGNAEIIELGWSTNECNNRPRHLLDIWGDDLARKLGIPSIPVTEYRGDIRLGPGESVRPDELVGEGKYWVVMAGSKGDCQTKQWPTPYFQETVDTFRGSIRFVQCGATGGNNRQHNLDGVHNLVGKTSIRQFIRVIQHAEGVLCPITFAMHLAAAIPPRAGAPQLRPCVVLGGGRENVHVYSYPGHAIMHRAGMLPCNCAGSCWKSDVNRKAVSSDTSSYCHNPVDRGGRTYAKCQDLIQPSEVCRAIWNYYEGGTLTL
jgi:hypothetical protein